MSQTGSQERYGLFILSILVFLAGATVFVLKFDNVGIRALSGLCFIVSVYLVRKSSVHRRPTLANATGEGGNADAQERPGRTMWTVGIALVPLAMGSYFWLYEDALHGYNEALPVYVFAGVALACTLVWPYLLAKVLKVLK